jgi:hypothetical protein
VFSTRSVRYLRDATIELLGEMFSTRSVPRLDNEEQLRLRVFRRHLEKWELFARQSLTSKDVNTEAEEATALEAITKRQPLKIQQTEKS